MKNKGKSKVETSIKRKPSVKFKAKIKKKSSGMLFYIFLAFLLITSWSFLVEPVLIGVNNITLDVPLWHKAHRPLKMAVLSDFHIGFGGMDRERLDRVIRMTNAEKPDFVFLVGDYVNIADENPEYISYLADFKNFHSKYGVYAVLGNHESWDVRPEIRFTLQRAGVNILENKAVKFTINRKSFWLAGIEDINTGYPSFKSIMRKVGEDKNPILLLSHNPDVYLTVPTRINLTICGHTHGGQIYLPFIAKKVNPSHFGRRFLSGHIVRDGNHFFVSKGLGTTIIPARLFVQPEIVMLKLE